MKTFAFRLSTGEDLKKKLIQFTKENKIRAGIVLACVGSLKAAKLRLADERNIKELNEKFEIVSLTGTLCQDDVHIHISIADKKGEVIGGHLKEGCIVYTTAEVVVGELDNLLFSRVLDKDTGFDELKVSKA